MRVVTSEVATAAEHSAGPSGVELPASLGGQVHRRAPQHQQQPALLTVCFDHMRAPGLSAE
jgi:hypothetical protein